MNKTDISYNERDMLQELFDRSFAAENEEMLREQYRTLRRLETRHTEAESNAAIDITYLAENVTAACDIITADTGKSFVFCGDSTGIVRGSARLITRALLKLLSNAYFYGRENLIITRTSNYGEFIKTEVRSGGGIDFEKARRGGGLRYVRQVCESHGGQLLIECDGFCTTTVMLLPVGGGAEESVPYPDFFELVKDRLSPVYIEFFGQK